MIDPLLLGRWQVKRSQFVGKAETIPYKNKGDVLLFAEDGSMKNAYWDESEIYSGNDPWIIQEFKQHTFPKFEGWRIDEYSVIIRVLKVEGDNLEFAYVDYYGETIVTHWAKRV